MLTFISEADVREHLTLEESIDALDEAFRSLAAGRGEVVARRRLAVPEGLFHWMPASLEGAGVMGAKLYTTFGDRRESFITLFDAHTGRLLAIVQSYHLSMIRTAAATALATRHLARRDAHTVCMIGTGSTALLQVKGVAAVRPVDEVRVFGRRAEPREQLAKVLAAELCSQTLAYTIRKVRSRPSSAWSSAWPRRTARGSRAAGAAAAGASGHGRSVPCRGLARRFGHRREPDANSVDGSSRQ